MTTDVQVLFERAQKAARSTVRRWPAVDSEDVTSELLLKAMEARDRGAWYVNQPEGPAVAALIRKAESIASNQQCELDRAAGRWLIGDDVVVAFLQSRFSGEKLTGLYADLFIESVAALHESDVAALQAVYGPRGVGLPGAVRTRASRAKGNLVKRMNWGNIARAREAGDLGMAA